MFALVGPPILVEMILRYPERQEQLVPMLAAALEAYADIAGPKIAAAKKRAEKRAAELGASGIDELIRWLFEGTAAASGEGDAGAQRPAA